MGFNARLKINQSAGAITGFTGAAPQTVTGSAVSMAKVEKGTLSALVYGKATTNTLAVTAKWQVSNDNVTYRDAYPSNRPANVAVATGTGSAVTDTIYVSAPDAAYSARYARVIVVSTVGVGGGAGVDEASIAYNWTSPDFFG